MRSSKSSAKKLTKKKSRERSSSGSAVFSLGMSGGAVKNTRNVTRKASKSPRRTAVKKSPRQELRRKAVKNSSRIKSKRASKPIVRKKTRTKKPAGDAIANAERTQVADGKEKEASQAREMMELKQQLAAAEEKLKKSQANEMTLVDIVGELEDENAELVKAHQSKRSDSGQILADAKQYISELKKQLSDALNASYEYEELRANDQNDISELKRQLADALATIEELKADMKRKDENLEKTQVTEYDPVLKKIEQLSEQKSSDSTTGSPSKLLNITKSFFRSACDRHRHHVVYDFEDE